MGQDTAIQVSAVSKNFRLPHERSSSIKGLVTGVFKKHDNAAEIQHALQNISFEIKKGDFFGIVGRNGSGKSTMLKILAGIYQPSSGSVVTHGKLVPFIELGVGFNPELTGRENVFLNGAMLGFSEKEVAGMYDDIVAFAELGRFMDQKLKNYSSGMQVRLAFSMATRSEADILLIDEILAVGDADFQRKCFDYFKGLKGSGTTVVFVTHDMNAVREYCDQAILIEQSKLVKQGSPTEVAASYTQMFMDQGQASQAKRQDKRWGDKAMSFDSITLSSKRLQPKDTHLSITMKLTAHKDIDDPLVGFLVKDAAGNSITGTNNDIEHVAIGSLKQGESMEMKWTIPNIFNDGVHYVEPAVVYGGGHQVAEWWEEAVTFQSLREAKTGYLTRTVVDVSINRKQ